MVVSEYTWNLLFIERSAKRLFEKQVLSFLLPIIYYSGRGESYPLTTEDVMVIFQSLAMKKGK